MHPNLIRQKPSARLAFTLIELLVSMTVLTLLTLCVGQLVSSATVVTTGNRKRLDADSQARVIFDRLTLDFSKMIKRSDVHYLFAKIAGGSDRMFFYSEAPAFYDAQAAPTALPSSVALTGYRINAAYQFERLGKRLTWDGIVASPAPGGMVFLSPPLGGGGGSYAPDNASTLAGNWPAIIGTAPNYDGNDDDYHALAEQAFRLEFCYQLQDGTYSTVPVLNPAGAPSNLTAIAAPTVSDDFSKTYSVGSRWFDQTGNCAYVCVNNTTGAAVWRFAGLQDVRAVVVAVAILDAASGRTVPLAPAVDIGTSQAPHPVQVPQLADLAKAFADAALPQGNTGEIGTATTLEEPYFPPPNVAPEPANPKYVRLMAEAWNNKLKKLAGDAPPLINKSALGQVRVYQRYFVLNTNASSSR